MAGCASWRVQVFAPRAAIITDPIKSHPFEPEPANLVLITAVAEKGLSHEFRIKVNECFLAESI
jgi:hypothetical protein